MAGADLNTDSASRLARVTMAAARGLAFFFGAFSLANLVRWLLAGMPNQDLWWIDLSALPPWLAGGFGLVAAILLVWWCAVPAASRARRRATAAACLALAVVASLNAATFYRLWRAGSIAPEMPIPASLVYAAGFAWLAWRVSRVPTAEPRRSGVLGVVVVVAGLMVAFPLLQIVCFGTTDYRRPADAVVILGARVYADGSLSAALEDRVQTGVGLYRAGLVSRVVMSGGVGESGVDETTAMRDRAVQLGVPAEAILLDHGGVNTDATVSGTTAMLEGLGARRVLAVSQFWHLPRVKLAYLRAGWNVSTVPARASMPILQTPYLMVREIPAFWQYWAQSR